MKYLKSHFWYNKSQRNGILFLVLLIFLLQVLYFFVDFSSGKTRSLESTELLAFQKQIDSLKKVEIENKTPNIYKFNPNYITDFKGYKLGMSIDEIDRLHNFRKQNKWVNSVAEFQKVTKVSDSLLAKIAPYFKFPDWVTKSNKSKDKQSLSFTKQEFESKDNQLEENISTTNINRATAKDFEAINGIGEVLSKRIVKYRSILQGFSYENQLYEVWGLDSRIVKRTLKVFKVVEKPVIQKTNINVATFKEVLKNPYIDYRLCKKIFEYRDEVAELKDISELKRIKNFPLDKYDRIILYLKAE